MIQWVMRTQWWRRKYLSTFQTHSNFVGLKCTYRPEAGQNLLCFLLGFFWIIQAAPEACEPHTSEPWHHHNMDIVVHVGEVPLLLSAKWQVSNINITLGSSKPTTHLSWNHQVSRNFGRRQRVRPTIWLTVTKRGKEIETGVKSYIDTAGLITNSLKLELNWYLDHES